MLKKPLFRLSLAILAVCGLTAATATAQQTPDVVTVGTVAANGPVINVPVYVRDVAGTPLGIDQPFGSRIQAFSIKVDYPVSPYITGVTFTRAGITAGLTPTFETSPSAAGTISLLMSFDETTNLVPFVSNAPAPGNPVGQLTFTFAPSTPPGTNIPLTLDATLTQLDNDGGTTTETTINGALALVNGAVTVLAVPAADTPTLGTWALLVLAAALTLLALRKL
jgi:hypothetical protein